MGDFYSLDQGIQEMILSILSIVANLILICPVPQGCPGQLCVSKRYLSAQLFRQ